MTVALVQALFSFKLKSLLKWTHNTFMTESPDYMKNRHNIVQYNKGNIQRIYNNIQ